MKNENDLLKQQLKASISGIWSNLTENEIAAYETRRDVFFNAVREKYGMEEDETELSLAEAFLFRMENASARAA